MPVIKSEIGKLPPEEQDLLEVAEIYIDQTLRGEWTEGDRIQITFSELETAIHCPLPPLTVKQLVTDYRKAGWSVKLVHNNDGSWLEFS